MSSRILQSVCFANVSTREFLNESPYGYLQFAFYLKFTYSFPFFKIDFHVKFAIYLRSCLCAEAMSSRLLCLHVNKIYSSLITDDWYEMKFQILSNLKFCMLICMPALNLVHLSTLSTSWILFEISNFEIIMSTCWHNFECIYELCHTMSTCWLFWFQFHWNNLPQQLHRKPLLQKQKSESLITNFFPHTAVTCILHIFWPRVPHVLMSRMMGFNKGKHKLKNNIVLKTLKF